MIPGIRRAGSGNLDNVHTAYGAAFADEAVANWTGLSTTPEAYRGMSAAQVAEEDEVAAQHPGRPHLFPSSMSVVPGHRGAGLGAAGNEVAV